jgi:hypothetical protein
MRSKVGAIKRPEIETSEFIYITFDIVGSSKLFDDKDAYRIVEFVHEFQKLGKICFCKNNDGIPSAIIISNALDGITMAICMKQLYATTVFQSLLKKIKDFKKRIKILQTEKFSDYNMDPIKMRISIDKSNGYFYQIKQKQAKYINAILSLFKDVQEYNPHTGSFYSKNLSYLMKNERNISDVECIAVSGLLKGEVGEKVIKNELNEVNIPGKDSKFFRYKFKDNDADIDSIEVVLRAVSTVIA